MSTAFHQRLSLDVLARVRGEIHDQLAGRPFDALLTDDPEDVAYLSGFFHHPGERPVAVLLTAEGGATLLVPELERQHAEGQGVDISIISYPEYPGLVNPFAGLNIAGSIGVNPQMTLHRLTMVREAFPAAEFTPSDVITAARQVKHPEEVVLHREAARITDLMLAAGVGMIRDRLAEGKALPTERELAGHVGRVGVATMYADHAEVVVHGGLLAGGLVYAGPNSAVPHALPSGRRVTVGESIILSLGCSVGGRYVEGERTFVVGEPTTRQRRLHEAVQRAQAEGTRILGPEVLCRDSNAHCRAVIENAGLGKYLRHRQGHGIGLGMHEPPWLEDGDATPLQPGMILSNEPGIYLPGEAGFRISDTMLITEWGAEPLTSYPRTLDDCVIAV